MKKVKSNLICVCGHMRGKHDRGPISGRLRCETCVELNIFNDYVEDGYHKFKQNNLDIILKAYDETKK